MRYFNETEKRLAERYHHMELGTCKIYEECHKKEHLLKLRTPETLMRQGFIRFSDIRHHYIMHTVSGTFPIDPAVLP